MKFSEHLGKGAWAFASRGLPVLYAVAIIAVARAVPKDEFGILGVFQTIFIMLFTFSDNFALQAIVKFGVEPDVVLEELVTVTVLLFLGFLALTIGVLVLFAGAVSQLLNIPSLSSLFPLLALFAFVTVPRVTFSKVLQMQFRMRELFFVDFANFGVGSIIIFVLLFRGQITSAKDVIEVTILSGIISSIVATVFVRGFLKLRPSYSRAMLKRISAFVRYQGATGIVSVLQQNLDTLVVSGFTGAAGVATYQGAKILYRGYDMVRDTLVLFIFPASSKYHSRGEIQTLRTMIEKAISFLYLLLIPVSVVLIIVSPMIFHAFWGTKYNDSISVFQILATASLFLPIQLVLTPTMIGMGRVKEMFRMLAISLVADIIFSVILIPLLGINGAALAFIAANLVQTFQLYLFISKEIQFERGRIFTRGFTDGLNFLRGLIRNKAL